MATEPTDSFFDIVIDIEISSIQGTCTIKIVPSTTCPTILALPRDSITLKFRRIGMSPVFISRAFTPLLSTGHVP